MFQTAIQLHENNFLYVLAVELNYEKLNWFELRPYLVEVVDVRNLHKKIVQSVNNSNRISVQLI
jgi:hypothetical protein